MNGYHALAVRHFNQVFFGVDVITRDLEKGMKGDDVKLLQRALTDAGYPVPATVHGDFGPKMFAAVKAFQNRSSLGHGGAGNHECGDYRSFVP